MKSIITFLFVFLLISNEILSQIITGKLVDENGVELAEVQLQLYTPTNVYNSTSNSDGTFYFNIITGFEDNQLPTGYSVSDNFPNPFNPRTKIGITLPSRENVKVEVFNPLGQLVTDVIEETFEAGTNYLDLELKGLSNGFYISRITIDDKYTVVKKLMLIYGSQHLITRGSTVNSQLNKLDNTCVEVNLDSLVATSAIIGRKTFTNLPIFTGGILHLGNLTIERYCPDCPTILYEGKIYHTVQIGNQCWLKENLNVGTRILGTQEQINNLPINFIEKYCYDNLESNCTKYGGLYQWNEAMQYVTVLGAKGICPVGWHLPTFVEFQTLLTLVGGDGNTLKKIGQGIGEGEGTNTSGFSTLLSGIRNENRSFSGEEYIAYFWSSKEGDVTSAGNMYLSTWVSNVFLIGINKNRGCCIRCLKD